MPGLTKFPSGAVRSSKKDKGRFDLLPPRAIKALAVLMQKGAEQYGEHNWQKGMPKESFMDSGIRHAFQALKGDTDENHLIHAAWNFLCCYELAARAEENTSNDDDKKNNNEP